MYKNVNRRLPGLQPWRQPAGSLRCPAAHCRLGSTAGQIVPGLGVINPGGPGTPR